MGALLLTSAGLHGQAAWRGHSTRHGSHQGPASNVLVPGRGSAAYGGSGPVNSGPNEPTQGTTKVDQQQLQQDLNRCVNNTSAALQAIAKRTLELGNQERAKAGAPALQWNDALAKVAQEHSCRMAYMGFFSHIDPERGELQQRLRMAGISFTGANENIYREKGKPDPALSAIEAWLKSEHHRRNLLDRECQASGVGVATARDGMLYFTQDFVCATPLTQLSTP